MDTAVLKPNSNQLIQVNDAKILMLDFLNLGAKAR
jgi:hypothetical protein